MTASIPHVRRRVKPYTPARVTDCTCIQRPICPCELCPAGKPGCIQLNGKMYLVAYHGELPEQGDPIIRGYRFTQTDGTFYDVSPEGCDCADCTYRQRLCKHLQAVERLLASGDLLPINAR